MVLVQKGVERRKASNLLKTEYFSSSKTVLKIYNFLTFSALLMFPSATVSQFHPGLGMPAPTLLLLRLLTGCPSPVPGQIPSSPLCYLRSACSCQGCSDAVGTVEDSGMLQQTEIRG